MKLLKEIPQNYNEFIYNDIQSVKDYIINFETKYKNQKKKALIIFGPPGIGKSCSVKLVCKMENFDLIIIGSDEKKDKEKLKAIENNIMQNSLFMKKKVLLIDDIDSFSSEDRGGLNELVKLIEKSPIPIVLTANEIDDLKYKEIKKRSILLFFKKIPEKTMEKFLIYVKNKYSLEVDEQTIKIIVKKSQGDLRGALIDLFTCNGNPEVVQYLFRDKKEHITQIIRTILFANSTIVKQLFKDVDPEELINWIDENIAPYANKSTYDALAYAGINLKRVKKYQYWRLLVYALEAMAKVADTVKVKFNPRLKIEEPKIALLKWIARKKYAQILENSEKIARELNVSKKEVLDNYTLYAS